MQAVKALVALYGGGDAAEGGEGRRGVHGDDIIAEAAIETEVCFLEVGAQRRDVVGEELHDFLAEAESARAGDADAVVAIAAEDVDVRRADVDVKAVGQGDGRGALAGAGLDVGRAKREVGGVHEGEVQRVVAQTKVNIDLEGGSVQRLVDDEVVDAAEQIGHHFFEARRKLFDAGDAGDALKRRLPALFQFDGELKIRALFHAHVHAVIALAGIDLDRIGDIAHGHVDHVILRGAVIGDAVRALDIDHAAGGEVQARQHDVDALKVDVDVALELRAALAVGGKGAVLGDGVLGDDVDLDVALLFLVEAKDL